MRKILASRIFRIWMLAIWIIILFSGSKNVNGFSWFGLRTQKKNDAITQNVYVPKETITDVIIDVLATHNKIKDGLRMVVNNTDASNWNMNSVPGFLSASQRLIYTDILVYLENASNKEIALDSFTSQLEYYQSLGANYKIDLQNMIQEHTSIYESCSSQKELADNQFYQWLNGWGESQMLQWLSDSHVNAVCQTNARVDINAYKAMLARIDKVQSAMITLNNVLTQNHDIIIDNFQLFKNNNLEKLLAVRNQLRAASPSSVGSEW